MTPRLVLLLGLTAFASTTEASAAQGQAEPGRAQAQIRAAGFRVLIGMRPDSLLVGCRPGTIGAQRHAARPWAPSARDPATRADYDGAVYGTVAEADLIG
jgi:hypothetical protein